MFQAVVHRERGRYDPSTGTTDSREGKRAPETLKPDSKAREMELALSEQAERQLADVGITVGGYRLEPALGGKILRLPWLEG